MPQVSFDTHAAARKLEEAGHTARQAQAVVEVVSAATTFGMRMAQDVERIKLQVDNYMATKSDIANMATKDDIAEIRAELKEIRDALGNTREVVREVLRHEVTAIQNRWLLGAGSISLSMAGFALAVLSNERLSAILLDHGLPIGLGLLLISAAVLIFLSRQK